MHVLRTLSRLSRPLYLVLAALTYFLGAGIARYLGSRLDAGIMMLGLLGTVLAQASMALLAVVYTPVTEALVEGETREQRRLVRNAALYLSAAALAAIGFIGFVLGGEGRLSMSAALLMGLWLLGILLYAVPPIRLLDRGFGELLVAVQIGYLAPSIGFLIQAGGPHRLLSACGAALTLLLAATLLALNFPSYGEDLRLGHSTALTRMGWEQALRTHHMLVICAYLVLALSALLGFSFELFLPAFLTLPFAGLQVYLLRGIGLGARPIWRLLTANAVALFGLTAYFLTLSFWLR